MAAVCTETRQRMLTYWQGYGQPSVEMMMLDSSAEAIADRETLEILDLLPPFAGLDVVELGCGIGRFTRHLADSARSLHSSDFMEAFVEKNREVNGHYGNLRIEVADATQMTLPDGCADLVFTNWLFMYLNDSEVRAVFARILDWLRPGGRFFFRESCFHKSGSVARGGDNPTEYRTPQRYNELLLEAAHGGHRFALEFARPSRTYVSLKRNRNQICWRVAKTPLASPGELDRLRAEADAAAGLLRRLDFAAAIAGGQDAGAGATQLLVEQLDVKPGETVLDVGCGLGEITCLLARQYGAYVTGVDISGPLMSLALQRANQQAVPDVIFEAADIEAYEMYDAASFDVIYSRDVMQYISDKEKLLGKFFKWLKPGGRLFLTDCCVTSSSGAAPDCHGDSREEVPLLIAAGLGCRLPRPQSGGRRQQRQSCLAILGRVGFVELATEDATPGFMAAAEAKCHALAQGREIFVEQFGLPSYQQALSDWHRRLAMCQSGELAWTLYHVIKRED